MSTTLQDHEYHESQRPPVMLIGKVTEAQIVAAAMLAAGPVRRHCLPIIPPYTFRDRQHGRAYHQIVKALASMPDGYSVQELADRAGVTPAALLAIESDADISLPLKSGLTSLLAQRVADAVKTGLDPLPYAEAMTQLHHYAAGDTGPPETPFVNLADVDLDADLSPAYLIDRTLEENSLAVLFGPSGHGKTFIVLDMALSIATGQQWNGKQTRQGVVVYLCGEGHSGIRRRIKSWLQHRGIHAAPDSFVFTRYAVPFSGDAAQEITSAAQAAADRAGVPVRLFVIDTLDRHIDGDENKTPDMGKFIKIADSLKHGFSGSTSMIVHHTGKADYATGRGASNLRAAVDFEARVMDYSLMVSKVKDGPVPDEIPFKLLPVQIGLDDDGEPVTSCVPEYGSKPAKSHAASAVKLTRYEQQALQALVTACTVSGSVNHAGQYTADVESWREEFYRLRRLDEPGERTEALKKQFQRARGTDEKGGGLIEKQIVFLSSDGATLLRIFDNEQVKQAGGTRDNSGTLPGHVPLNDCQNTATGHRDKTGTTAGHVPSIHTGTNTGTKPPLIGGCPVVPLDTNERVIKNQSNGTDGTDEIVPADDDELDRILLELAV